MISEIAKIFYVVISGIYVFFVDAFIEVFFILMLVVIIGATLLILRIG